MRAKEFGLWKSRAKNAVGGMRDSGDPFNRALKGQPYQRPKEYNNTDLDEYHRYPEFRDLEEEEEEKKQSEQKDRNSQNSKAQRSAGRTVQNVVGRFVAMSVGAIMVANTYTAMGGKLPFEVPFSSLFSEIIGQGESGPSTNWKWSEDHTEAILELSDGSGAVIKQITAVVDVEVIDETCTEDGSKTFTASAEDEGTSYTDTYTETLPPLGHDFGEWKETVLEDGETAMVSECSRCSEQFIISTSVEENDG